MIDIKNLKIGQRLYVVQKEFERGIHRRELDKVIKTRVIKVGKRYVTVNAEGFVETFDSHKDFKIENGCGKMKYGLYLCAQDYLDELTKEDLLKEIIDFFSYINKQCELLSLEELESINEIVKKYQERQCRC